MAYLSREKKREKKVGILRKMRDSGAPGSMSSPFPGSESEETDASEGEQERKDRKRRKGIPAGGYLPGGY